MSAITIYMEGGGESSSAKRELRIGMSKFLGEIKEAAREKRWRWNVVCCGARDEALDKFRNSRAADAPGIVVMLVDSEGPVNSPPRAHLHERDRWDLNEVDEDRVHLMVQSMETWIVADRNTLSQYYGQGFRANALPSRNDLEEEDKKSVADALKRATERTQKGRYHKIHHAADLLAKADPAKVRERCRHCERLFNTLGAAIAAG